MESKHENDRLDDELMELFSAPVPSSFEEKWRSAIQREESLTMSQFSGHLEKEQKKTKRKWWKAALPAAAALVLVAGSCWVGAQAAGVRRKRSFLLCAAPPLHFRQ